VAVEFGQFGNPAVMPTMFFGGTQESQQRVNGHGGAHGTTTEAGDVGMVVLAGQGGGRHIVDDGGPDAGDLVGRHGDADARATGAHTQFGLTGDHRPPHRRPEVRVVDRHGGIKRAQVGDVMPTLRQLGLQDLFQVEPTVVRTEGDAHREEVYRGARRPFRRDPVASPTMALHPRTPVVVGVGQVTVHPDPDSDPADRPEPVELMARALRAAAEDCDGVAAGAAAPSGNTLIRRADSLRVVVPLGWRSINPALLVANRLGFEDGEAPAQLMLSAIGGNTPQALMHHACGAISRGELDVVMVTGAEAMYTRASSRRDPSKPALTWASQPVDGTPEPTMFGVDKPGATDLEMSRGVILPIHAYPLFENALRAANGWSLAEHRERIGALWARFSQVAAANPHAWIRSPRTAEEISVPSADNRMVSFPYPKLCTANMQVDQGAGYIVCSVEAARSAGVPEERWVFPLSGADANDHWFISHRPELHRSPAIRLAGQAATELAGISTDEFGPIDLYSCFPAVVQMAAHELGLPIDDPARPLTLTGGLTFGGGPGNNYTSHGIAQLVGALRQSPGAVGMATGLGWYATKHSVGLYGAQPPTHEGHQPFAWRDVQPDVDALPQCRVDSEGTGPVRVETYTVAFDRDGSPERGILACRTADDSRAWGNSTDADTLALLCAEEGIGRTGTLSADGSFALDG